MVKSRVKFLMEMPTILNEQIASYARKRGIFKSAVVKIAVSRYLEQEEYMLSTYKEEARQERNS